MNPITTAVTDALLRQLSTATNAIGETVLVRASTGEPEYDATIINVIIIPFSNFHRKQFLNYYRLHDQNAVKALKELCVDFACTPDYTLEIGYVLDKKSNRDLSFGLNEIKARSEFDFMITRMAV